MKFLFFDMEFADGRVPGSIYSLGYLITDENFEILSPPRDILINPDSTWNDYVVKNILSYPKEEIESAPTFDLLYSAFKDLFEGADVAIGFAVNNDTGALRKACERYGLEPFRFRFFDMERVCKQLEENREAHGLGGCMLAWCGEEPENRHRSDGDAYATMRLLQAICRKKHITPDMLLLAYPNCGGVFSELSSKKKQPIRRKRVWRGSRWKKCGNSKKEKKIPSDSDSM